MDASTIDIKTIFGQERRHVVPLFQRPYVWKRDSQLGPLWADVSAVAERLVNGQEPRSHFLGAIVLDHVAKPTGEVEVREVIDGQQRLTTLQLLFKAFADFCLGRDKAKHHEMIMKLVLNENAFSTDPIERFKVWPTAHDQGAFSEVMGCRSPSDLRTRHGVKRGDGFTGTPIADAYLHFHDEIAKWIDEAGEGPDSADHRITALYKTLRECLRFVVIDLKPEDDAQVIFESLNARGTPLLPADLVKNLLFHRAQLEGEDLGSLYARHWRRFDEEKHWREERGRGHAMRHRIDLFLQNYLTVKLRDEVHVGNLYSVFRAHVQAMKAGDCLADIARYADIFSTFDDDSGDAREAVFVRRLAEMDVTTAYPFLLEVLAHHASDRSRLDMILGDLESFLVRRMVCQLNTRGYNRLFIDLLRELAGEQASAPARVRAKLLAGKSDRDRWPDDDELRQAWLENSLGRVLNRKRVQMVLWAIEQAMRNDRTERFTVQERLTIEHLMPRSWETHWPLPATEDRDEEDPTSLRDTRNRIIHTFGNLTLLNQSLNPSVSNGPWTQKRERIAEFSILRLNSEFARHAEWDETRIRERGERLLAVFCKIWARPE